MLSLLPPSFFRQLSPQIDSGTCDFLPGPTLEGDTYGALATALGAPSLSAIATACAVEATGAWDIHELIAWFPWNGGWNESLVSDIRPAGDMVAQMRSTYEFAGLAGFKAAVVARRAALGVPMACMDSLGMRHADLQTSGFTNITTAVETWDIKASGNVVGAAFIGRTGTTTTQQHWVLYGGQPFDGMRCQRRTSSFASLNAFLADMAERRENSQPAFQHAVEECTHSADVPSGWSS